METVPSVVPSDGGCSLLASSTPHRSVTRPTLAGALLAGLLALVPVPGSAPAEAAAERVAGPNRVATAVAAARTGWDSADTVIVARADDPADALSGSALAGELEAPLLITPTTHLDPAAAREIDRLGASVAYVLGGPAALSDAVVEDLRETGVSSVRRIAGPDRYATAAEIARRLDVAPGGTALLISGWPDALGVAGLAAARAAAGDPWPVLVTAQRVPDATWAALDELAIEHVILIGGLAAITPGVEAAIARNGYGLERVAGPTRYATSAAVAALAGGEGTVVAATGTNFPDGLAAGPLAARLGATLLLVPPVPTTDAVRVWRDLAARYDRTTVVGGDAAVAPVVADRLHRIVSGAETTPTVRVEPGDELSEVAEAHPPGTTFVLGAGVHRLAAVEPQDGDSFIGEGDAVLSGARDISADVVAWQRSSGHWYLDGQRQRGDGSGEIEKGGNPLHRRPEELFVDDRRLEPVGSRSELGPGRWHFDYDADRIWLAEDPAGLGRIETSVVEQAFWGEEVTDVLIENLTIEKYANETGRGAINGNRTTNWIVRDCTTRWNHGPGLSIGPGMDVSGCDVYGNGQLGLSGSCTYRSGPKEGAAIPASVVGNRIHHNAELDFRWQWESGALKLSRCTNGLRFEHNWVHDNDGPGPWFDVENREVIVRSNLVEDNAQRGILYEISWGGRIFWNTVRRNAVGVEPFIEGAGIFVSNSEGVEVFANLVEGSPSGIVARSAADRDPHVRDLNVHHNDVSYDQGRTGLNVDRGEPFEAYTSWGNRFHGNTYRLPDLTSRWFLWADDKAKTAAQWRGYGQDTDGRFVEGVGGGSLPRHAVAFAERDYGAR